MGAGALIAGPLDGPLVVLIHGLAGSHHTWDRVLPMIEPYARVHTLDLSGTGSIEKEADRAAELIPRPAVLVGHSRGGLIATAIAERHPGRARKLILLCTPWAPESRLVAKRPIERALSIPGIGDLLWTAATDTRQRKALGTAFAPGTPIPDQFVDDLRATGRQRFVAASRAIDAYLADAPLSDRLSATSVPAELIFGEHDMRVARPPSDTLTHTVLHGVGHTPPWEAAARTAYLILSSLTKTATDAVEPETHDPRSIAHLETQ